MYMYITDTQGSSIFDALFQVPIERIFCWGEACYNKVYFEISPHSNIITSFDCETRFLQGGTDSQMQHFPLHHEMPTVLFLHSLAMNHHQMTYMCTPTFYGSLVTVISSICQSNSKLGGVLVTYTSTSEQGILCTSYEVETNEVLVCKDSPSHP